MLVHRQQGLTMAEILVVVLIISVVAAIGLPQLIGDKDETYNRQATATLESAWESAQDYYAGERGIGEDQGFQNSYNGFKAAAALKLASEVAWQGNTPPTSFTPANPEASGDLIPRERLAKAVYITAVDDQKLGLCSASRSLFFCIYDDGQASGTAGKTYGRRWGVGCTLKQAMDAAMRTNQDSTQSLGSARADQRANRPC